jgi:hypothetical protein
MGILSNGTSIRTKTTLFNNPRLAGNLELNDEILKEFEVEKKTKSVFASTPIKETTLKDSQNFYPAQVFNNDVYFSWKSTEDFCMSFKASNHQLLDMQQIIDYIYNYDYFLLEESA